MAKDFQKLKKNDEFWKALFTWWASLEHNRGQRAALRRAKSPDEVFLSSAYWRGPVAALRQKGFDLPEGKLERLALPIGILTHADTLSGKGHFAAQLGQLDKGGQAVRDVRFRKLLAIPDDDRDSLYAMLRRLTRMLGGAVHVCSLVEGGFYWNNITRREWARRYYASSGNK